MSIGIESPLPAFLSDTLERAQRVALELINQREAMAMALALVHQLHEQAKTVDPQRAEMSEIRCEDAAQLLQPLLEAATTLTPIVTELRQRRRL